MSEIELDKDPRIDSEALARLIDEVASPAGDIGKAMVAVGDLMNAMSDNVDMCREGRPHEDDAETYRYIEGGKLWVSCHHDVPHPYVLQHLEKP